jgi:hypothetical protein
MFVDVVAQVRLQTVTARHQNGVHAGNGVADFGKELMLGSNLAVVLPGVVGVCLKTALLHVFGTELDDDCVVVIQPDHGVGECHEKFSVAT